MADLETLRAETRAWLLANAPASTTVWASREQQSRRPSLPSSC
jgi:hypothetical protein